MNRDNTNTLTANTRLNKYILLLLLFFYLYFTKDNLNITEFNVIYLNGDFLPYLT